MRRLRTILAATCTAMITANGLAQQPVVCGQGSYAPYPPSYKGRTDEHAGFNATKMMTRRIYADEKDASGNQKPIPTNDWWTDLLNNEFSGALWSYPAMVRTSADGFDICYPTYWNENGTEVKSKSYVRVGAVDFSAQRAMAADWHDWDVTARLESDRTNGDICATLVHGNPFTIFEFHTLTPEISFSEAPEILLRQPGGVKIRIGEDLYGIWYDDDCDFTVTDDVARIDNASWVSVGLLKDQQDFAYMTRYAASAVRSTAVSWGYDEKSSMLRTDWHIEAVNLRDSKAVAPLMQGFLPHAYKHWASSDFSFDPEDYLSPRGRLKMAVSDSGDFSYAYRFSGMLPSYAAPDASFDSSYRPEVLKDLIGRYAEQGSFGDDTYWGGKGLTQMALNMTFAKSINETEIYETSKKRLKEALVDWLTYTPGEETKFFSYYPRWGGMLGFDVSYDSDAFNDHHFHYGYFLYAAALLCLEDDSFRAGYGDILRLIAKDYANYDRDDTRFPYLRTLDPWAGHSYAGGLGDHLNDNGNGQESSSESMQGWGGVYLLGVALGDNKMRDAGIFGWLTESRATAEYWFDRDHIYADRTSNYDYSLYASPYNTNLTSKGIGWWTWFSGDSLWMHSIQWMPVSPCLQYLSEDLNFVKWDYEKMLGTTDYKWFEQSDAGDPLADQSVGNVVLCYMERSEPQKASDIFDEALEKGFGIARNIDTGHISYYVIHNHLTYGDPDFSISADCPTASAFRRADGKMTYVVYNPDNAEKAVNFYRDGVLEKQVMAPGRRMTAFSAEALPSELKIEGCNDGFAPRGASEQLSAHLFDQYGASCEPGRISWSVEGNAEISEDGVLRIAQAAADGNIVTVTAEASGIRAKRTLTVGEHRRIVSTAVERVPEMAETGTVINPTLKITDQYGTTTDAEAVWTLTDPDGNTKEAETSEILLSAAGKHILTGRYNGSEATTTVVVLPPLPNIALGCDVSASSEENAGTLVNNVNDGDAGSRWGSAHTDNEWLMLDLGADYRISSVTVNWEVAYATDYDILIAPDGSDPDNPEAWAVAYSERGLTHAGKVRHALTAEGRYVKIDCKRRATTYGYSIYEIEIGGYRSDTPADTPVGIDIKINPTAREGEATPASARLVRLDGAFSEPGETTWSSDKSAKFGNGSFLPESNGLYNVKARCGELESSKEVLVEESFKLKEIAVTPASQTMLTGGTCHIEAEGHNQFGGLYPLGDQIEVKLTDESGNVPGADEAGYDIATGTFRAEKKGNYILDFAGLAQAKVTVKDLSEANLAAGKKGKASSSEGGNTPDKAFDENLDTRWESKHVEEAWLSVDLEDRFILNRVELYWEAAYSTAYDIQTSTDGLFWDTRYSTEEGKGGHETVLLPDVSARYVRINCRRRALNYGHSLYEMQVYGKERDNSSVGVDGIFTDEAGSDAEEKVYEVYNLQGIRIGMLTADKIRRLNRGIYIIDGRKLRI